MSLVTFTAYRKNLSERGTHNEKQANPDDQPQYEGVIFTDGTCVIRWRTACKSTSVFANLQEMIDIHGHPEYGTEIDWHGNLVPGEWLMKLANYKIKTLND